MLLKEVIEVKLISSNLIFYFIYYYFLINLFIYVWLRWVFVAVRGLYCGERGLFFVAVCGLLIAVAFLVAEYGF